MMQACSHIFWRRSTVAFDMILTLQIPAHPSQASSSLVKARLDFVELRLDTESEDVRGSSVMY